MRSLKHQQSSQEGASTLACAVALSDHYARKLQLGGRKRQPCQLPGSPQTLAQLLGLIPKPEQLLTPEQWTEVHGAAARQGAFSNACAICLESSEGQQQVLLSCSHAFHVQCLGAFERHVRSQSSTLVCPLCRKPSYQKRLMPDPGAELIRGCRALGQSLEELVQQSADAVDSLEAELDASLVHCRQLMNPAHPPRHDEAGAITAAAAADSSIDGRQVAAAARLSHRRQPHDSVRSGRSRQSQPRACSGSNSRQRTQVSRNARVADHTSHTAAVMAYMAHRQQKWPSATVDPSQPAAAAAADDAPVDWEAVVAEACERGETDCAICLATLLAAKREVAGVALLSCTHTFHMQCVLSFEEFEAARGGKPSCPVCRAAYSRRCFAVCSLQQQE